MSVETPKIIREEQPGRIMYGTRAEGSTPPLLPELIHLENDFFDAYIGLFSILLYDRGPAKMPSFRKLLSDENGVETEEFKTFKQRVTNEVARSLAGTKIPRDRTQLDEGIPYDEVDKIPAPISVNDLEARRSAVNEIIRYNQKLVAERGKPLTDGEREELSKVLKMTANAHISEEQRAGYIDNMRRTNKYALRGNLENGDFTNYFDMDLQTDVVSLFTTKRPFHAYRMFSNPDLPQEIQDLGNILGTVTTITTADNYLLLLKRTDNNAKYKGPGLFGGLFDDQGVPISDETVIKNNSEEVYQEMGIRPEHLINRGITSIVFDKVAPHGEITETAETTLTSDELVPIINANAVKPEARLNEYREPDYFFVPNDPEILKRLLTEVRAPFPPTHLAALIASAGKALFQEKFRVYWQNQKATDAALLAYQETKAYLDDLVPGIAENYREINKIAAEHWRANPGAWEEYVRKEALEARLQGLDPIPRSNTPPEAWDPSIKDPDQGLIIRLRTQLLEKKITTPDKIHGPALAA